LNDAGAGRIETLLFWREFTMTMKRGIPIVLPLLWLACNVSVNRDIRIEDGSKRNRSFNTVNGSVVVGADCDIRGEIRSVNGSIEIGPRTRVSKVQSVNGGIRLLEDAQVDRALEAVNGSVEMGKGGSVAGVIKTVNGAISLDSVSVRRDIVTFNGNVLLDHGSVIGGDIRIKRTKGNHSREDNPILIEVTGGSVVKGGISAHETEREVHVILSNGGKVIGRVEGAKIIEK
jgi:DUF4097 and DUF4098 domain-containing protein YvlB